MFDSFLNPGAAIESIHFPGASGTAPLPQLPSPVQIHYLKSPMAYSVQSYERLRYPALYPGVDLTVHSRGQQLDFDMEL